MGLFAKLHFTCKVHKTGMLNNYGLFLSLKLLNSSRSKKSSSPSFKNINWAPGILLCTEIIRGSKNKPVFCKAYRPVEETQIFMKNHTNTCNVATVMRATKERHNVMRVHIQRKLILTGRLPWCLEGKKLRSAVEGNISQSWKWTEGPVVRAWKVRWRMGREEMER